MNRKSDYELSTWVYLLRFIAGYINVMTILMFAQMLVGHTGSITTATMLFVEGDLDAMLRVLGLTLSFFIGTIISGYFYPTNHFQPRMQYGNVLIGIGLILLAFAYFGYDPLIFLTFISLALGLQNGMFVFYRGLIVITTILTGTITDIGVEVGRKIKGVSDGSWKFQFHIWNVAFFIFGALVAMAIALYTDWSLVAGAAVIDILIGIYFFTLRDDLVEAIRQSMDDAPGN